MGLHGEERAVAMEGVESATQPNLSNGTAAAPSTTPKTSPRRWLLALVVVVGGLALLIAVPSLGNPSGTPASAPASAPPKSAYRSGVDPRDLAKDSGAYQSQPLTFSGRVLSIQVTSSGVFLQLDVNDAVGGGTTVVDARYPAGTDTTGIEKGGHATVWGRGAGSTTITNGFGAQIEQPVLDGDYLDRID